MPIDNLLFEDLSGFIVDIDVTNTGTANGIQYDTFMSWFTLSGGGGEVSFIF